MSKSWINSLLVEVEKLFPFFSLICIDESQMSSYNNFKIRLYGIR